MTEKTSIVDIFAGPGGLGEGFSSYKNKAGVRPFTIDVSIEKEATAHKTLELRSFFRQFDEPPNQYYQFVKGKLSKKDLFRQFQAQAKAAKKETLAGPRELGPDGNDDEYIYRLLEKTKRNNTGPWVVIGGPPCQAYSLVGRARNKGNSSYKAIEDNRHFLYREYLRVLKTIRPAVFVMENVKGILSSKVGDESIFPKILGDLRCPQIALGKTTANKTSRYKLYSLVTGNEIETLNGSVDELTIKCENYGIPQARHRVILIGVREDIKKVPQALALNQDRIAFENCISDLPKIRSGITKNNGSRVLDTSQSWFSSLSSSESLIRKELHSLGLASEKLTIALNRSAKITQRGGSYIKSSTCFKGPPHLRDWFYDPKLEGVLNHESKGHMASDLARYMFCALYAQQHSGESPTSRFFPESLAPAHKSWKSGKFADRFRVLNRFQPAKTITSHIAKDGHAFIHYDPAQCRSLTVREAARIQTFPDNYFFEGQRTAQSIQVGNAVPPYLAYQIAEIVYDLIG